MGRPSPAKKNEHMQNISVKRNRPETRPQKPQRKAEARKGAATADPSKANRRGQPSENTITKFRGMFNKTPDLDSTRAGLANGDQKKPLRDLVQFDALITRNPEAGVDYNSSGITDEDGDCINCERKLEPRATGDDTVRIQVPVRVTPAEAVRVLRKTADWIESRPDVLKIGGGPQAKEEADYGH